MFRPKVYIFVNAWVVSAIVSFILNDMEIPGTKRVIPKGCELGATLS